MKNNLWIGLVAIVAAGGVGYVYWNKSHESAPVAEQTAPREPKPDSTDLLKIKDAAESQKHQLPPPDEEPKNSAAPSRSHPSEAAKGHFEIAAKRHDRMNEIPQNWFDKTRAQKLREIFQLKGSDLSRYVRVQSIECNSTVCTVEAKSRDGDMEHFQSSVFAIIEDHPWVGNKIDVTTLDSKGLKARFVFIYETSK